MKTMHSIASALVLTALTLSPAFGGMMEQERRAKFTGIGSHSASGTVAVAHGDHRGTQQQLRSGSHEFAKQAPRRGKDIPNE